MKKIGIIAIVFFCICAVLIGLFRAPVGKSVADGAGSSFLDSSNSVGVIRIEGVIVGGESYGGMFGAATGSDTIIRQLHDAQKDPDLKVILIRINSPGGSAPAAQEIGVELEKLKKSGKKVVVSMGDMAASGGYWIAALSDYIIANPATMTGSIGVIMEMSNMEKLYEKIGYDSIVIKSGPYKDIGSSDRPMTDKERQILQGMVDDIFGQFVDVVAKGRHMDRNKVLALATGEIFTGRQAKKVGLVDELGSYYDALDKAAEMGGLGDDYEVKELNEESPWDYLMSASTSVSNSEALKDVFIQYILSNGKSSVIPVQ